MSENWLILPTVWIGTYPREIKERYDKIRDLKKDDGSVLTIEDVAMQAGVEATDIIQKRAFCAEEVFSIFKMYEDIETENRCVLEFISGEAEIIDLSIEDMVELYDKFAAIGNNPVIKQQMAFTIKSVKEQETNEDDIISEQ